jgi:hypothetical protein
MPGMKSPEDWDYDALRKRCLELHKPPFCATDGKVGNHCLYCKADNNEHCHRSCSTAYRELYGIEPNA